MTAMNRRDAVKAASTVLGGVVVLGALPGCGSPEPLERPRAEKVVVVSYLLDKADEALLADFADTLLPDTYASPGAKAAGCGPAMNLLVTDCRDAADQQRVVAAIAALRTRAPQFASMMQPEREALLRTIDGEAVKSGPMHWFHLLRDLALTTYFSSEVGVTKAMRYVREPGRYIGCVPLTPGQPAWS